MDISRIWRDLEQLRTPPQEDQEAFSLWLNHEDSIEYLLRSSTGILPFYISADSFFAYSILLPENALEGDYVEDLLGWNFTVSSGWSYTTYYENNELQTAISPPIDYTDTKLLEGRQPIVYYRRFDGKPRGEESYLELDQAIAHILEVHWIESRNSYCKLNHLGDIKEVVKFSSDNRGLIAVIDAAELDFFLYLTKSVIVRVFDVTRYKGHPWPSDPASISLIKRTSRYSELHAKLVVATAEQSYLRGFQIVHRSTPNNHILEALDWRTPSDKKYESFIAYDWKNQQICECSCSPDCLANYFTESDLPFEVTPAFFRPDVLLRYKQDPDKFTIGQRQITCRGTWSLSYDINDQGQVHVYLCDLGKLPYEEQVYWKSFNEAPKSGISKRAFKTDFEASWDIDYEPHGSLKSILSEYPKADQFGSPQPIWRYPDEVEPLSRLVGVVTEADKEWEDQILELSKIIIDNFSKRNLRKVARILECDDPSLGSLKLIRRCLESLDIDETIVNEIIAPLEEIWSLRSSGIAHFGGKTPRTDLRQHFKTLLEDTDKSMRRLAEFIKAGFFDISMDGELQKRKL